MPGAALVQRAVSDAHPGAEPRPPSVRSVRRAPAGRPFESWSPSEVAAWVLSLASAAKAQGGGRDAEDDCTVLRAYAARLLENDIDGQLLASATEEDLAAELGMTSRVHRRRIYTGARALVAQAPQGGK